ncbi:Periplasmic zinc-binding protein TroA precursor [Polystyrenella longa]|uniref:Periplasmic zinc-binding protein TroA n=1 Tax=Polystyrenella longa TaxID=2528007 RepID=A0A518CNM7_9PLAN|nr:zinc ABC transporter substrate-binding protein [Polystyrenella longa]QDU80836.1 Periplasmic zinc-binding protein TroA precursor [Polystyrenella longa]
MKSSTFLALTYLLLCFVMFSGCDGSSNVDNLSASGKLKIVTTTGMVTDIVREIVGDRAEVVGLMGPAVDPHLHQPLREDAVQLSQADIVFYSGLMLEGRMAEIFEQVNRQGKPIFAVTAEVDHEKLREPPEFAGHPDPHVWMNISLWKEAGQYVVEKMTELDPEHAEVYQHNWDAYSLQLDALAEYAVTSIESIPAEQRVLVTAHDAFGYFGDAYGMTVLGVQGITTESAAGVDDINKLVDFIVERKIKAIFVESSVAQNNIRALIEGAANRGWTVEIGGSLYSDAMGETGTYEGTYIGMIDHNVTIISQALGGKVPAGGLNGKLKQD